MLRVDAKTNSLTKGLTQNLFKIPFTRDKSIKFDGTDDFVETGIQPDFIHTNATMAYWVKMQDFSDTQLSGSHHSKRFYLGFHNQTAAMGVQGAGNVGSGADLSSLTAVNQWHHIALVADNGTATYYLDGVARDTMSYTPDAASNPDDNLYIGAYSHTSTNKNFMNASIDEFAVFSSALTAREIDAIYNNGQPTNLSSYSTLAAWYRMGEGKDGANVDGTQNLLFQGLPTTRGSELITNADFSSASGWNLDANASISGGKLVLASSTGISYQNVDLDNGAAYEVIFTVENLSSGTVKPYLNGTNGTVRNANGTYKEIVLAGSSNNLVGINPSGSMNIDNFSIKKLTNVGTISGALIKDESTAESVPKQCKNLPSAGSAKSLSFDGTDDVVDLGPSDQLITGTNVTVSMWFKIGDTSAGAERIFVSNRDGGATNLRFVIETNGTLNVGYKNSGGSFQFTTSPSAVDDGLWHNAVFTTTSSAQVLYIDGSAVATTSNGFQNGASTTVATTIGAHVGSATYADVDVDEFAIWDTVLDGDAVKAIYNAGLPTPVTTKTGAYDIYRDNLKAYYKMGDASDPAVDGTNNLLFDQTSPGVGSEFVKTAPFVSGSWSGYSANVVTFPSTTTVRIERPTSGGSSMGAAADLTTSILQSTPTAGTTLKISFDLNTDDSDLFGQIYNGSAYTNTTTGSGSKTVYLKMTGTGFIRFGGLDADKFVELSNLTIREVNGHTGTITGATIQTEAPKQIYALPAVANTKSINFDGTNDHLVTQVDDTAQPNNESRYYSWWSKSSDSGGQYIFDHGDFTIGGFGFNISSGRPLLYMAASVFRYFSANTLCDDGTWHHWVVRIKYNDITGCELWCDGVKQGVDTTNNSGSMNVYTSGIRIGRAGTGYFQGSIDEFSIHEDLDEEGIRALYNRGRPIDISRNQGAYDTYSDNLLHWWRMGDASSPAADGTNDIIFQGLEANIGPELMKADDDLYIDARWYVFSDPEKTYPNGTAARFTNPASGGWNQGGRIFLTSGGTIHALTENMETGSVYKLSFDFQTDDSDAVPSYHDGTSATSLPAGSGSKTFYFAYSGNASTRLEAANVSASKFVEFSKLSLTKVGGAAVMTNMTTSDIQTDTPY